MHITEKQVSAYRENGFLLLQNLFSKEEIDILKAELPASLAEDSPRRVIENGTKLVRSVYGTHTTNQVFHLLTRHPRIVEAAMQILGGGVYVYQFKINAKAAFGGDVWQWHQDYVFWRNEDGMPTPRVINVAIFLDDVNDLNGPMLSIPGSHKEGVIESPPHNVSVSADEQVNGRSWITNLTADLRYSVDKEIVKRLAISNGMVSHVGPAGTVVFFDANLIHASSNNISPFGRVIIIITFNSVENVPELPENPRPDFLVSRDCRPIVPLTDDALLRAQSR